MRINLAFFLVFSAAACAAPASRPFEAEPAAAAEPAPAPARAAEPGFGGDPAASSPAPAACASPAAPRAVDVIVSVDQSTSMAGDIANVKVSLGRLASVLDASGVDYHVVVIGKVGDGHYELPDSAATGARFRAVDREVQSMDTLEVILETLDATSAKESWRDFLREGSLKVFVPITDDDSYRSALDFDRTLLAKAGDLFGTPAARRYVFMPITGAGAYPSEAPCSADVENQGSQYLTLAKLTNGRWSSICDGEIGSALERIGADAVNATAELGCAPEVR